MPTTPKWRPRARSASVVGDLEAVAVVGDRQHRAPAERAQPHRHRATRARGARRCAAPRAGSTPARVRRPRRARRRPRSRAPARRCCAAAQRSASALSADRQRQRAAFVGAQARDDLARLARRLAGVLGEPRAPPRRRAAGSRSIIARERRAPRTRCPETVLASESCMSRASRERSPSAAIWRSCAAIRASASAWRSSSPRARGARRGDDHVQRRLAEVGLEGGLAALDPVAHGDRPVVDADQQRREHDRARPAVQQTAEQRGGERVVEERALRCRSARGSPSPAPARPPSRPGWRHEHRPDPVPVAQRDERRDARRDQRERRRREVLAARQRDHGDQQQPGADRDDQLAGRTPASRPSRRGRAPGSPACRAGSLQDARSPAVRSRGRSTR